MTIDDIIASLRHMEGELASLRAHVAALTAAPATTTEPGLDLDACVPCASCGGEFTWVTFDGDDEVRPAADADCQCGVAWYGVPAPVTWRTLATSGAEVPAAYVARLVAEVDRLNALLTASAPSSTAAPHSGAVSTVEEGAFAGRRALPPAESTDYPVWIIVSGKFRDRYHAGPWFSREAATEHLVACRHRYPRGAIVYCHTGHMSYDYRHLCETGTLPPKESE